MDIVAVARSWKAKPQAHSPPADAGVSFLFFSNKNETIPNKTSSIPFPIAVAIGFWCVQTAQFALTSRRHDMRCALHALLVVSKSTCLASALSCSVFLAYEGTQHAKLSPGCVCA
jgi:hypothetical protein